MSRWVYSEQPPEQYIANTKEAEYSNAVLGHSTCSAAGGAMVRIKTSAIGVVARMKVPRLQAPLPLGAAKKEFVSHVLRADRACLQH